MTRHERRLMWQERVDQCRASGMSVAAWCRENEVSEQQMYYWLRKFRSEETDAVEDDIQWIQLDRKSTRLNSSHVKISYAVFCLKKKKKKQQKDLHLLGLI